MTEALKLKESLKFAGYWQDIFKKWENIRADNLQSAKILELQKVAAIDAAKV